jgi:hypothetical protein
MVKNAPQYGSASHHIVASAVGLGKEFTESDFQEPESVAKNDIGNDACDDDSSDH